MCGGAGIKACASCLNPPYYGAQEKHPELQALISAMSAGPIALLGGLETNPLTLVAHFFSVALFGVGRLMVPLPTPARIWKGVNLLKGAVTIIVPIVSGEGLIRMFVPSKYREKARII